MFYFFSVQNYGFFLAFFAHVVKNDYFCTAKPLLIASFVAKNHQFHFF